jgi:hypothetical protein
MDPEGCWFRGLRVVRIQFKVLLGNCASSSHHEASLCLDVIRPDQTRVFSVLNHDLYSSPNVVRVMKSRRMRWARQVARMGEGRGAYRVLVGRPEGKRPLGRPRRRWHDNIKM